MSDFSFIKADSQSLYADSAASKVVSLIDRMNKNAIEQRKVS